jgi:hypothetical protein
MPDEAQALKWPGTPVAQTQQQWPGTPASNKTEQQPELTEASLLSKGKEILTQRDEGIDYDTGAPIGTRVELQRASNPEEAKKVLEKSYGQDKYGQDRFGQYWVQQGDKRVSVLPKGISGGIKNVGTGMLASTYPMAGAVAGGVLGEIAMPAGGGIPGAMIGAAVGKGVEDMVKWAQGVFAQSTKETVTGMSNEAAIAGVFQGAGPLLRGTGQAAKGALQKVMGVTPATRQMAQDVSERSGGAAKPPISSFAPGATALEYKRQMRNTLAGSDPAEAGRIKYLTDRMDSVFEQEGVSPPEREKLINEIYDTSARTSASEAGEKVVSAAKDTHSALLNEAQQTRARVAADLAQSDTMLRQIAQAPPSTAADVSEAIRSSRRQFAKDMNDVYESIHNLTGQQPLVETAIIQDAAKELVQVMPPNALPPLIQNWAKKGAPDKISFPQAHALRSTLREMSEVVDVSPLGQRTGNVRRMASAVNSAIGNTADVVGQAAAVQLRAADKLYSDGIAKFNNTAINRIVRELRTGIVPEPNYVASLIMQEQNPQLAKTIFAMLPQNVQTNVIKADLNNLINQASRRGEDGVLRMDGASFMRALDDHKPILDAVYPPKSAAALRQHAMELAAFDGKVDVTGLKTPTAITNQLERAVGAARAADEFVKTNPLGALSTGTPMQVDRALARLTLPGSQATTEQAAKTLGVDSEAWKAVRKYAVQKLFSGSVRETASLAKTISGKDISDTLNRYTKRQQELLFPGGMANDLRLLAKESKFLFPHSEKDFGGSLAAAAIKSGLWFNPYSVYKYIRFQAMGYVADHPKVLRFLTDEIRKGGVQSRSLKSVMGQWLTERALMGGPGRDQSMIPAPPPKKKPNPDIREINYNGPMQ